MHSFLPQPIPPCKEGKYSRKRKTLIDIRPNAQTHINMSILKNKPYKFDKVCALFDMAVFFFPIVCYNVNDRDYTISHM